MENPTWRGRWRRRAISLPLLGLFALLYTAALPLVLLLALGLDLARPRRFAASRMALFLAIYLWAEALGVLFCGLTWLWSFGALDRLQASNRALQRRWNLVLVGALHRIFGLRVVVEGEEALSPAPFLLFMRHASTVDTILPMSTVAVAHDLFPRYVLKAGLCWDPCLDLVGHRLPNVFVHRGRGDPAEVARVGALGAGLTDREFVVLYPEGTRFTQGRRATLLDRLQREADAPRLAQAMAHQHTLPPRHGGPLALIAGAPGVDVVFCAHTGLEGVRSMGDLMNGALVNREVRLCFWRVPRAEIPDTEAARATWLDEEWLRMDRAVGARTAPAR